MPFLLPRKCMRNSARYQEVASTPEFVLQQHRYSIRKRKYHVRIITRSAHGIARQHCKIAKAINLGCAKSREWKYIVEELPQYLPNTLLPGSSERIGFALQHLVALRARLGDAASDDKEDEEEEEEDEDEYDDYEADRRGEEGDADDERDPSTQPLIESGSSLPLPPLLPEPPCDNYSPLVLENNECTNERDGSSYSSSRSKLTGFRHVPNWLHRRHHSSSDSEIALGSTSPNNTNTTRRKRVGSHDSGTTDNHVSRRRRFGPSRAVGRRLIRSLPHASSNINTTHKRNSAAGITSAAEDSPDDTATTNNTSARSPLLPRYATRKKTPTSTTGGGRSGVISRPNDTFPLPSEPGDLATWGTSDDLPNRNQPESAGKPAFSLSNKDRAIQHRTVSVTDSSSASTRLRNSVPFMRSSSDHSALLVNDLAVGIPSPFDDNFNLPDYLLNPDGNDPNLPGSASDNYMGARGRNIRGQVVTMEGLKRAHEKRLLVKAVIGTNIVFGLMRLVSWDAFVLLLVAANLITLWIVKRRHLLARKFVKSSVKRRVRFTKQWVGSKWGMGRSSQYVRERSRDSISSHTANTDNSSVANSVRNLLLMDSADDAASTQNHPHHRPHFHHRNDLQQQQINTDGEWVWAWLHPLDVLCRSIFGDEEVGVGGVPQLPPGTPTVGPAAATAATTPRTTQRRGSLPTKNASVIAATAVAATAAAALATGGGTAGAKKKHLLQRRNVTGSATTK